MTSEIRLAETIAAARNIVEGQVRGRLAVGGGKRVQNLLTMIRHDRARFLWLMHGYDAAAAVRGGGSR